MKEITVTILKKNRVFFKAILNGNGHEIKLRVTPESADLQPGQHTLLVNDESVRTKYGTDVIYSVASTARAVPGKITTFHHTPYNYLASDKCKKLGGKWDSENNVWVFSSLVESEVEEIDELFNFDSIGVEITAKKDLYVGKGPVDFLGYTVARAFGRDSGAKLGDQVSCISGKFYSCGSVKNWATEVAAGSVFKLRVCSKLLEKYDESEFWEIKVL